MFSQPSSNSPTVLEYFQSFFNPRGTACWFTLIYRDTILGVFKTFHEACQYQTMRVDAAESTIQLLRSDAYNYTVSLTNWNSKEDKENIKKILDFIDEIPSGNEQDSEDVKGGRVGAMELFCIYMMIHPEMMFCYPNFRAAVEKKAVHLKNQFEERPFLPRSSIITNDLPLFLEVIKMNSNLVLAAPEPCGATTEDKPQKQTYHYNLRSRSRTLNNA